MTRDIVTEAFCFAESAHNGQQRKYTGEPYIVHPVEVRRLVEMVPWHTDAMLAAALLHDVLEDTDCSLSMLRCKFGREIANMVMDLTDQVPLTMGNRRLRKRLEGERLGQCSAEVQTIKVADMIDNTRSIVAHDPGFAKVYLEEKRFLLSMLTKADQGLRSMAYTWIMDPTPLVASPQ